jgi:hypothetical protein
MGDELTRIQERLASDIEKTVAFFEALPASDSTQPLYTTGSQWQVGQLLAHFVSAERTYTHYLRDVLQGGPGVPKDFDLDAFNDAETPALSATPIPELITALRQTRADLIDLTRSMTDADLDRAVYHPWFGQSDMRSMLKLIYRHHLIHLRDARAALETGQPVPHREIAPPAASER